MVGRRGQGAETLNPESDSFEIRLATTRDASGVAAIYRLRATRPDLPRPYRAIGYPVIPAIFIASVAAFVINSLMNDTTNSVITFAVIFAGLPIYELAFARRAH